MLSHRNGTVNDFHWEFKPALSYSKPHTFSTFLEKKKKQNGPYILTQHTECVCPIVLCMAYHPHTCNDIPLH